LPLHLLKYINKHEPVGSTAVAPAPVLLRDIVAVGR